MSTSHLLFIRKIRVPMQSLCVYSVPSTKKCVYCMRQYQIKCSGVTVSLWHNLWGTSGVEDLYRKSNPETTLSLIVFSVLTADLVFSLQFRTKLSSPIKTKDFSRYTQTNWHTPHQGQFGSSFTMHHGAVLAWASLRDGPQRGLWLCWRQWHNSNT